MLFFLYILSRLDFSGTKDNMARNQLLRSHLEGYGMASNVSLNQEIKKKIKAGLKIHTFAFGQSPFPVMEEAVNGLREYAEENDYVPVQGKLYIYI